MAQMLNRQRFIVDLPASTARSALSFLSSGSAYADLSEFVAVALENQLRLEEHASEPTTAQVKVKPRQVPDGLNGPPEPPQPVRKPIVAKGKPTGRPTRHAAGRRNGVAAASTPAQEEAGPLGKLDQAALLQIPDVGRVIVAEAIPPTDGASLSPFTNRLNPLVVPLRVLANATVMLDGVSVNDFTRAVPILAREVGMRLKREDELRARRGRQRRWTGWPVGEDVDASLARFRNSFLLKSGSRGEATGPLVDLGLVSVSDRLLLTARGLEIAADKTPLLGEVDGEGLLSVRQRELFREALVELPGERDELRVFLKAVNTSGGEQSAIDQTIQQAHPTWTEAQVISHRAAVIGRLRDVGVIDAVPGQPGQEASIVLEPQSAGFEDALGG